MGKSPAFQFYASDFLASCASLSLEETGAHIKLLAWSWDNGPIPNGRVLTILGGSARASGRAWDGIRDRWRESVDGWTHGRLEETRLQHAAFAERQSTRGRRGADVRWRKQCSSNGASNAQASNKQWPGDGSPSPSPSPDLRESTERSLSGGRARAIPPDAEIAVVMADGAPLIDGAALRLHGSHAWCGPNFRMCVPRGLHTDFIARLSGGDDRDAAARLFAWYPTVVAQYTGRALGDDLFAFWRNSFAAWVGTVTAPVALQKPSRGARTAHAFDLAAEMLAAQDAARRDS